MFGSESIKSPLHRIAVVIPTKDRYSNLLLLLKGIERNVNIDLVIVVDASKYFSEHLLPREIKSTPLVHLKSGVASAAVQRNVGLDYLNSLDTNFDYVAFLDDDVEINSDYFSLVTQTFVNDDILGVSGVAVADKVKQGANLSKWGRLFLDSIGYTGASGSVTRAAINVPIDSKDGVREPVDCEWLIGCSVWKWPKISDLRFEADFPGSSIFEDVIFSMKARSRGKLIVNPNIVLRHHLLSSPASFSFERNRQWARNRYRVKEISPERFSSWRYCFVNFLSMLNILFRRRAIFGAIGVLIGTLQGFLKL